MPIECYNKRVMRHASIVIMVAELVTAGCATTYNAGTSQEELILINTDREVRMGAAIARQVEQSKDFTILNDPAVLARIDRIGHQLAAVSDRKDLTYHFFLLDWEEVNAFAVPGGYIYLSNALVNLAQSDDELASVLGHEISHIVAKHSIKRLQAAYGADLAQILLAATAGRQNPRAVRGAQIALAHLFLAYSRQDELEADTLSVRYLQRAGFNPEGALTFLERLQDYQRTQPSRPFSYARTHPYFDDRIRVVKQAARGQVEFDDYINMSPETR